MSEMVQSQGQDAGKSVRVNLTIPVPVHEVLKRGARLSGLSVSGFIASWLVFELPALRAWLRQYHNVRAGELSFEGDPLPSPIGSTPAGSGGFPVSAAQREDAVNQQAYQVKLAQRELDQQQARRDAAERVTVSRAERRRDARELKRLEKAVAKRGGV